MRHNYLWPSLIAAIAMYSGCSDDSSGQNDEPKTNCTADADCDSNKCLDIGKCAVSVSDGDDCDSEHICKEPFVCKDGTCRKEDVPPSGVDDCTTTEDCKGKMVCKDSKCVDVVQLGRNDICDPSDESAVCGNELTCINNKCLTQEDIEKMSICRNDDDCAHEEIYKNCLPDGVCGLYLEKGEDCMADEKAVCKEGMSCLGVCFAEVGEGERCAEADATDCGSGLNCIDEVCRHVDEAVQIGGTCNDKWLFCADKNVCKNEICVTEAKEDEHCDEAANILCAGGMLCLNSVCTPVGDHCTATKDCLEKDSFCCLDESCGAKGYCIPYDDKVTYDDACRYATKPGIFEAQIQCRWQPDTTPSSNYVEMPPLVGHFGNSAGLDTAIAVYSYSPTRIRFINPENCQTMESIEVGLAGRWYNYPSAADFDGDGLMELVTGTSSETFLYKWDPSANGGKGGHVLKSRASVDYRPMGMIYDIDNDGNAEIVGTFGSVIRVKKSDLSMEVLTKTKLFKDPNDGVTENWSDEAGDDAAIGNLDNDPNGIAELVTAEGLYTWNSAGNSWTKLLTFPWHNTNSPTWVRQFAAYADFGTYHPEDGSFDYKTLDGKPEIVISGKGKMNLYAVHKDNEGKWSQKSLMTVTGFTYGGPITIGDFNNDGLPEIGIASSGLFGVYDPKCTGYVEGKCADKNVLWERWSQDNSSGTTASSLFDFDGDGQAEAVYADECFTRVYDGKTGRILFSAKRSSVTSIEGPVIADVDNDGSAEIVMGSDQNYACYDDGGSSKILPGSSATAKYVDPLHEGIRCQDDEDCPSSKNCDKKLGLCLCTSDSDCNTQYAPNNPNEILQQYVCTAPIHPSVGFMTNPNNDGPRKMVKPRGTRPTGWKDGDYQVCRATRKTMDIGVSDLMIFKDRLDRWVSSRNIWNQHAYNIINIEDNGVVPSANQWLANWVAKMTNLFISGTNSPRPLYNNYRLNKQGKYGAGTVPDITGRFIAGSICGTTEDGRHVISGKLCNRGTKPVSTNLPATFFYYNDANPEDRSNPICTSYTKTPVGIGECAQVGCEVSQETLDALEGKKVLMVSNLDEHGFASTVECNSDNNTDVITVESCKSNEIVIVN